MAPTSIRWLVLLLCLSAARVSAEPTRISFRDAREVQRWRAAHDVSGIRASPEGMIISIAGSDPFIVGSPVDRPADVAPDTPCVLELKLKSEQGGMVEVFYFAEGAHAVAGKSASARVSPGDLQVVRIALPALE